MRRGEQFLQLTAGNLFVFLRQHVAQARPVVDALRSGHGGARAPVAKSCAEYLPSADSAYCRCDTNSLSAIAIAFAAHLPRVGDPLAGAVEKNQHRRPGNAHMVDDLPLLLVARKCRC